MVDYQFVTERLAVGGTIETLENMKEVARDGITHVVNMQRQTPSIGSRPAAARAKSRQIPARSGSHGPGEMTIASGAASNTCSTLT